MNELIRSREGQKFNFCKKFTVCNRRSFFTLLRSSRLKNLSIYLFLFAIFAILCKSVLSNKLGAI